MTIIDKLNKIKEKLKLALVNSITKDELIKEIEDIISDIEFIEAYIEGIEESRNKNSNQSN